ncbi:MAG: type IV pilus secretin PilQ family protein [Pseudomonadales bacterium]
MATAKMKKQTGNMNKGGGAMAVLARTLFLVLSIISMSAVGKVTLQDIEFSSLPGDKTEIRMKFDGKPPEPTGYTIEQPARIALDLTDVTSALKSRQHSLGSGNARSVTVMESGGRTRVIVAMTELVGYSARVEGNSLYVLVGQDAPERRVAEGREGVLEEPVATRAYRDEAGASLKGVDFRRGAQGEGRVIVELSEPGIGVDVATEGGDIRVQFTGAHIPDRLQRRLDVTDFATPVLSVATVPEGDDAVLRVTPTGDYDYLAYQADDTFTLEVKRLTPADMEAGADRRFKYDGERLSLNFQDIEIRSVLQLIADFTDMNLVASDTISGRITLRLKNVPWDQALDIILKTKGLAKREDGNVLMVAPASELAAREKLELESRQQISELAPMRTEFIEVKYANAAEIFNLFQSSGDGDGVLSERGNVIVDERTNSIILTDTAEKISEFRSVLDRLDVPVRQVQIEARIVTANANFSEQLGVRWGGLGRGNTFDNNGFRGGGSLSTLEGIEQDGELPSLSPPDGLMVDLGVSGDGASSFAVGLLNNDYMLELELSALEQEGNGEVISRPKVITADKQQATISSGTEIPYQEASSSGATATSFASATLGLDVKPQITPDDRIILQLEVKQDEVGAVFNGVPSINTNRVQTQVLVNDGETVVLGGIFTTRDTRSTTKTPFLGDLPYVGRLFKRNTMSSDKEELLIFITPRLIQGSLTSR